VKSRLSCRSQLILAVLPFSLIVVVMSSAQELLSRDAYRLIKESASGELPFADFATSYGSQGTLLLRIRSSR